jgi:hypothetical protein
MDNLVGKSWDDAPTATPVVELAALRTLAQQYDSLTMAEWAARHSRNLLYQTLAPDARMDDLRTQADYRVWQQAMDAFRNHLLSALGSTLNREIRVFHPALHSRRPARRAHARHLKRQAR